MRNVNAKLVTEFKNSQNGKCNHIDSNEAVIVLRVAEDNDDAELMIDEMKMRGFTEVVMSRIIRRIERLEDSANKPESSSMLSVLTVVDEMERHISGVEGAEDIPVAMWARELREVVGWPVRGEEDARAAKWVREHGGIGFLEIHLPNLWSFIDHIMDRLGVDKSDIDGPELVDEELDRRLMPPGMEWPRFEDGEKVHFMNACISDNGEEFHAKFIGFGANLETFIGDRQSLVCAEKWNCIRRGERVKRPAVLAADGDPIEVGHETGFWPDDLTHVKPEIDSWERVEEDARGLDSGVDRELFTHTHEDIVRRCRALAERERGE